VQGPIVKEFGRIVHPVYKTVTMSVGVDIQTSVGESVACVAPGRIDYVGRMRGYGKFVIVNHTSGFLTIYTHLDSVAVAKDQPVESGEILGTVGETGSLEGSRLHFEIRKSTEALNPREWLEKKD
jgi:septal ring factor EnvC (AmiA/AmiB activator)